VHKPVVLRKTAHWRGSSEGFRAVITPLAFWLDCSVHDYRPVAPALVPYTLQYLDGDATPPYPPRELLRYFPPFGMVATHRGSKYMRRNLLTGAIVGVYAFLGMFSGRLLPQSWYAEKALASHYGKEFSGKETASGGRFSPTDMTADRRSYPWVPRLWWRTWKQAKKWK
jgi:hypothetical protein